MSSHPQPQPASSYQRLSSSRGHAAFPVTTILSVVSWVEIFAIALLVALLRPGPSAKAHVPVREAVGWDILCIDGDRANDIVLFNHTQHRKTAGEGRQGCLVCHHMSQPGGGPTRCCVCHRDMVESMLIFDHESHQKVLGGNRSCEECHQGSRTAETAKPCKKCHPDYTKPIGDYVARGYVSAMHSCCIGCHAKKDQESGKLSLSRCDCCHMNGGDKKS